MTETANEKCERVRNMILNTDRWDLSFADREALRHIVGMVYMLAEQLASQTKTSTSAVLTSVGDIVHNAQQEKFINEICCIDG